MTRSERPRTEDDRQTIIIEFIKHNPYCSRQKVVEGVKDDISRVTVFKILDKLIESGAVQNSLENEQKRNSRQHRLIVNEGDPLVSVRSELNNFQKAYFDLFSKSVTEFDLRLEDASKALHDFAENVAVTNKASEEDSQRTIAELKRLEDIWKRALDDIVGLLYNMLKVFFSMVDAYLCRFLLIWSLRISDKKVLQQLYSMVFSRIADMQTHISEILKSLGLEIKVIETNIIVLIRHRFRPNHGLGPLESFLQDFKEIGKEKEIEPVIDSLWNIIGDLQPHIYPEPQEHGWPFKYGEDDWRKLVRLLRQHSESIPFRQDLSKDSQNTSGSTNRERI
jgi:hypothetical protein